MRHHSDDNIRNLVQIQVLPNRIATREQLFGSIGPQKSHPTSLSLIIPVIETSLANAQTTNFAKLWIRSRHQQCCIVIGAMGTHRVLLQFRNRIFAVRRLGLHERYVGVLPVNGAPGALSPGLQAGAPVKHDHDVLTQILGLIFLPFAQAFSGGNHQHNRHDPPGNSEHREESAQLMRPQGAENVANEIAQHHRQCFGRARPVNVSHL